MSKYKLRSAIAAVLPDDKLGMRMLTIPTGATLTLLGTPNISGLVDAQWEVILISVFMRDVVENGELIKEKAVRHDF